MNGAIAVFGAYGHTGRFVVAELCRRGWTPVLSGRDAAQLAALQATYPALEMRTASIDSAASLDRMLHGVAAVINCAGPFMDTAAPVIEAALRAGIHYMDVCAEQQTVLDVFDRYADAARAADLVVVPAMAFYGGLADLLATAAMGEWPDAERIDIAVALDSWHPTVGTRRTGERNTTPRKIVVDGQLVPLSQPPPQRQWQFQAPFGTQETVALPLSEIITISRHLRSAQIHSCMNLPPLRDLRDPDTPPPTAIDADGRSAQNFALETMVGRGEQTRYAHARGRDIYAITAPLVVEALQRTMDGRTTKRGVLAPGDAFVARDFLAALLSDDFAFEIG